MPHLFPALIAKGLSQTFASAKPVLIDVDLTVQPGQIHAVVGQSGAGKTVLADILSGVARPTGGTTHIQGQLTSLRNEQDAVDKKIRYVKQLWDRQSRMSVADALCLEAIPRKFGLVDGHALIERAHGQLSMAGLGDVDPKARFCELTPGKQKMVLLGACLSKSAALFILDDPTAALSAAETELLFQRLSQLQYADTGIVYCTSSAEEALQVGDQISVLRDGRLIATHDPESVFVPQIAGEMVGRDTSRDPVHPTRTPWPEVAFRVEGLCVEHCVYGLSLKVRRGEILGLLGLQGGGQSEAVRALGGVEPRTDGEIYLRAAAVPTRIKTREEALANGVGLVLEPSAAIADPNDRDAGFLPGRSLYGLNAENPQRAPIAKCLKANCSVMLFDNPTRGLNVACRLEVNQSMQSIADQGVSIVVASTHVEDLMRYCDRIAMMVDGRIVRTFDRSSFSADKIQTALKARR